MPRRCDPNATFKVVLHSDAGKQIRPAFIFRFASVKEWKELTEVSDRIDISTDAAKMIDEVTASVKKFINGWENLTEPGGAEIAYDIDKLEDLLTPSEITELLMGMVAQIPTIDDKKKLDSQ